MEEERLSHNCFERGEEFRAAGKWEEARDCYEQYIKIEPDDLLGLARYLESLNQLNASALEVWLGKAELVLAAYKHNPGIDSLLDEAHECCKQARIVAGASDSRIHAVQGKILAVEGLHKGHTSR